VGASAIIVTDPTEEAGQRPVRKLFTALQAKKRLAIAYTLGEHQALAGPVLGSSSVAADVRVSRVYRASPEA
jgi:hypothetical protein